MSRERIFVAAKSIVDREGVSGLTIRKVASKAGLSPMAMYRHFADKDALLDALMADGMAAWETIVRGVRAGDPMQWLQEVSEAFLDFAMSQPHRFDAAFFLPAPKARRYPDDFAAGGSPAMAMIMARIEEAKAQGRLQDKPALEIALTISAMAQGMVSMQRANRFTNEKQFRALYRAALRHCLESFASKPVRRTR